MGDRAAGRGRDLDRGPARPASRRPAAGAGDLGGLSCPARAPPARACRRAGSRTAGPASALRRRASQAYRPRAASLPQVSLEAEVGASSSSRLAGASPSRMRLTTSLWPRSGRGSRSKIHAHGAEQKTWLAALDAPPVRACCARRTAAQDELAQVAERDRSGAVRVPLDAGAAGRQRSVMRSQTGSTRPGARVLLGQPGAVLGPGQREVEPGGRAVGVGAGVDHVVVELDARPNSSQYHGRLEPELGQRALELAEHPLRHELLERLGAVLDRREVVHREAGHHREEAPAAPEPLVEQRWA